MSYNLIIFFQKQLENVDASKFWSCKQRHIFSARLCTSEPSAWKVRNKFWNIWKMNWIFLMLKSTECCWNFWNDSEYFWNVWNAKKKTIYLLMSLWESVESKQHQARLFIYLLYSIGTLLVVPGRRMVIQYVRWGFF